MNENTASILASLLMIVVNSLQKITKNMTMRQRNLIVNSFIAKLNDEMGEMPKAKMFDVDSGKEVD